MKTLMLDKNKNIYLYIPVVTMKRTTYFTQAVLIHYMKIGKTTDYWSLNWKPFRPQ